MTELGVVVSSSMHPGTPSYAAAELAWALVLASMRRLPQQVAALKAGMWRLGVGHTIRGKTLGFYGFGRISRVVSGVPEGVRDECVGVGAQRFARARMERRLHSGAKQEAFFSECDVISLHMRLVDATRGIVTAAERLGLSSKDAGPRL